MTKLFNHGDSVSFYYNHQKITNAKVSIEITDINRPEHKRFYLCSNEISGNRAPDLLGYPKSWEMPAAYLGSNELQNFEITARADGKPVKYTEDEIFYIKNSFLDKISI